MAKVKVFDNFGKEIKDDSLVVIIGEEKNRFGFVKIVEGGIDISTSNMGTDYTGEKTVIIKEGGLGISGNYTYEELEKMNIVVIK